jgi:hypothetical protein
MHIVDFFIWYYGTVIVLGLVCMCFHVYATTRLKRTDHLHFRWLYEITSHPKYVAVAGSTTIFVFIVPTIPLGGNMLNLGLLLAIAIVYVWTVRKLYVHVNTRRMAWLTWKREHPDQGESMFYHFTLDDYQQHKLLNRKEGERSRALKRAFEEYKKTGLINIPSPNSKLKPESATV